MSGFSPFATSQRQITFSIIDATVLLSGENASPDVKYEGPSSLCSVFPVAAFQSKIISCDVHATILPSGENVSPVMKSLWPSKVSNMSGGFCLCVTFQRVTVWTHTDATTLLSGENASPDLQFEGPLSLGSLFPVAASQSKMVRSRDIDATILPSGETVPRTDL